MSIKIIYDGFNPQLDNKMKKIIKQFGYEFDSSGFNFRTKKRDLYFTKEN